MGAIIRGFMGGAGKGMADVSQMLLADKLSKERDEADYLRRRELSKDEQSFRADERMAGEKYGTSEREAGQEFKAGESEKDRKLDIEKTNITAGAKVGDNLPADAKTIEYLVGTGWKRDVAEKAVLNGMVKVVNNADGTQTVLKLNKETNNFDIESSVVPGDDVGSPAKQYKAGEVPPNTSRPTKAEIEAQRDKDQKSKDWIPFNEKSKKEYADEVMADRGHAGGIINSQRATEKPAAVTDASGKQPSSAPKKGDIAMKNGVKYEFDGTKFVRVKNQ